MRPRTMGPDLVVVVISLLRFTLMCPYILLFLVPIGVSPLNCWLGLALTCSLARHCTCDQEPLNLSLCEPREVYELSQGVTLCSATESRESTLGPRNEGAGVGLAPACPCAG